MTTSAPSYWTCQCGVQVPMGCSHTCAHVGPTPGREITVNPPWPTELIAALTERADAAEAALAETRERLEGVERVIEPLLREPDVLERAHKATVQWEVDNDVDVLYWPLVKEAAAALSAYRATLRPPREAEGRYREALERLALSIHPPVAAIARQALQEQQP